MLALSCRHAHGSTKTTAHVVIRKSSNDDVHGWVLLWTGIDKPSSSKSTFDRVALQSLRPDLPLTMLQARMDKELSVDPTW